MADLYTDFRPTDSSPPLGDSEGRLQPEEDASGWAYSKRILRYIPMPLGDIQLTLSGSWHLKIRENIAVDSSILFEQKITFRALAVFDGFGGVTYIPLDDGGKFETIIVNGQAVPQDEAGHYEGWRYVDTPTPTKFSEFATPIFKPNSGGAMGGLYIDVDWRSPRYKIELPAGAVLRVEEDQWRDGSDIPIAWFHVSLKNDNIFDVLREPDIGQSWTLYAIGGTLYCATSYAKHRIATTASSGWQVLKPAPKSAFLFRRAPNLLCLAQSAAVLKLLVSGDNGITWKTTMNANLGLSMLAGVSSLDGGVLYIYGVGSGGTDGLTANKPAWAVLKNSDREWKVAASGVCKLEPSEGSNTSSDLPVKGALRLELLGATFRLTSKNEVELGVWTSVDEMRSWKAL